MPDKMLDFCFCAPPLAPVVGGDCTGCGKRRLEFAEKITPVPLVWDNYLANPRFNYSYAMTEPILLEFPTTRRANPAELRSAYMSGVADCSRMLGIQTGHEVGRKLYEESMKLYPNVAKKIEQDGEQDGESSE